MKRAKCHRLALTSISSSNSRRKHNSFELEKMDRTYALDKAIWNSINPNEESNTLISSDDIGRINMNFQSVNPLNVRLNLFSGNLLPMTSYNSSFPLLWKMYSMFVWIIELIIGATLIPGCMYVSTEKVLKDGMICFAVFIEMTFLIARIHIYKNVAYQLIRRLNNILHVADETMMNVVTATLKPVEAPLNFYWSIGVISIIAWTCIPLVLVFKKNLFYYEDYRIPAAFSRQPFSLEIFLLGSVFLMVSAVYMFLQKVGVDVYMIHLVLMTTAQYRYIATKIAMIFQANDENNKEHSSELNQRQEKEFKVLCRHHNSVIQ